MYHPGLPTPIPTSRAKSRAPPRNSSSWNKGYKSVFGKIKHSHGRLAHNQSAGDTVSQLGLTTTTTIPISHANKTSALSNLHPAITPRPLSFPQISQINHPNIPHPHSQVPPSLSLLTPTSYHTPHTVPYAHTSSVPPLVPYSRNNSRIARPHSRRRCGDCNNYGRDCIGSISTLRGGLVR